MSTFRMQVLVSETSVSLPSTSISRLNEAFL